MHCRVVVCLPQAHAVVVALARYGITFAGMKAELETIP